MHTILRGIVLQLMQLSNFYCNWKTIHHRNFMVGLGESVIYNKWWNSLSLAIWLHTKDAKCRYGHLQSNTIRSLQVGRLPRLHMSPSGNINTTEHNFLSPLWFSLSIHDIGSFIQKKNRKKNWLLKNYYFSKLIWPCRSIGQQRSHDPTQWQ